MKCFLLYLFVTQIILGCGITEEYPESTLLIQRGCILFLLQPVTFKERAIHAHLGFMMRLERWGAMFRLTTAREEDNGVFELSPESSLTTGIGEYGTRGDWRV